MKRSLFYVALTFASLVLFCSVALAWQGRESVEVHYRSNYNPYHNRRYIEPADAYWRGPRVPVVASDGTVRHVSRAFIYNTTANRYYGYGYGGYSNYSVYRYERRSNGILTRVLDFLI